MDPYQARNHMETYYGQIKSPNDAVILFEACRQGALPRVQRRLSEKERNSIRSGSVFVWDEREAGMRRWTDGKSWSASRVSGSFLTYREMEGKRTGFGSPTPGTAMPAPPDPDPSPDGYTYKPDGLVKQSFSITTSAGQHLHLISYFSRAHPSSANLPAPTNDPNLRHIRPAKGMYPDSTVHDAQNMPAVTHTPLPDSPFNHQTPNPGATNGANYPRQPPPPHFGWPQPPHTPPGGMPAWPSGYFPYPFPMQNGMPINWQQAAWFAQQMQMMQQQQQQAQGQGQTPAPAPFDRAAAPPTLGRGNSSGGSGAPLPPPAPAQPYPQHQSAPAHSGPTHGPSLQPIRSAAEVGQTPAYQNSNTYQSVYQAWAQQQAQAHQHQHQQPAQGQVQQNGPSREGQAGSTTPPKQPNDQQPQSQHLATPQRPPLHHTISTGGTPAPQTNSTTPPGPAPTSSNGASGEPHHHKKHPSIPSINALIDGGGKSPLPSQQRHSPPHQQGQPTYTYSHPAAVPTPHPQYAHPQGPHTPSLPSQGSNGQYTGQQHQQQPQHQQHQQAQQQGGAPNQGADMSALRRLDRAFAP